MKFLWLTLIFLLDFPAFAETEIHLAGKVLFLSKDPQKLKYEELSRIELSKLNLKETTFLKRLFSEESEVISVDSLEDGEILFDSFEVFETAISIKSKSSKIGLKFKIFFDKYVLNYRPLVYVFNELIVDSDGYLYSQDEVGASDKEIIKNILSIRKTRKLKKQKKKKRIKLEPKALELFEILLYNEGKIIPRDQLIETIWGPRFLKSQREKHEELDATDKKIDLDQIPLEEYKVDLSVALNKLKKAFGKELFNLYFTRTSNKGIALTVPSNILLHESRRQLGDFIFVEDFQTVFLPQKAEKKLKSIKLPPKVAHFFEFFCLNHRKVFAPNEVEDIEGQIMNMNLFKTYKHETNKLFEKSFGFKIIKKRRVGEFFCCPFIHPTKD